MKALRVILIIALFLVAAVLIVPLFSPATADMRLEPARFMKPGSWPAGRMLNEGFVAYLKQVGLQSRELPLEQGYASMESLGPTMEDWIKGSGAFS